MFLFLFTWPVYAEDIPIAWSPNIEEDLKGYKVYIGNESGDYTSIVDVGNTTQGRVINLLEGVNYYIAITAYDEVGNESDFSDEIFYLGGLRKIHQQWHNS